MRRWLNQCCRHAQCVPPPPKLPVVLAKAKQSSKKAAAGSLLVTGLRGCYERWSKKNHKNYRRSICHVLPPDSPDDGSHTTKVIGRLRFIASLKYNCFNLLMAFYQDLSETAVRSKLHHLIKSEINTDKIILQVGALSQSRRHEQVAPLQNHCLVEQDPPPSSRRLLL